MVKKLLFAVCLLYTSLTYAETIKTDVLVIGGTASGVAAAIQSARSKVKTLLIMSKQGVEMEMYVNIPDDILAKIPTNNIIPTILNTNPNLSAGIWGEFRERVKAFYKTTPGYDTTYNAPIKFEEYTGAAILKSIADTVKNLTIKTNTLFTAIKKDGTGWEVSITVDGKTDFIKAKVVIDATYRGEAIKKAGLNIPPAFIGYSDNKDELYRTSIAISDYGHVQNQHRDVGFEFGIIPGYSIPMRYAVISDADNLLVTERALPDPHGGPYLPIQLRIGQGVGCIAAYCAFFKTTTKNLKPRIIQQELLDFKGILLPFADIRSDDRYVRAIQQIGATGLLKGVQKNNELLFMPDTPVTTAEIKPVLTEIYSRAFLWFDKEKPGEKFTVGNTLSLISEFTLTDPETLQVDLQKDWQDKYKFTLAFDKSRPITRLEFAVLVNKFLNPFARKIDLKGNMIN
ncbi:MAG: FAD-dependent oxidoreductase [Mucilaginibacter sp.]